MKKPDNNKQSVTLKTNGKVIRVDKLTGETEVVSYGYAFSKLQGYWNDTDIKPLLESGQTLWTPYATYTMLKGNVIIEKINLKSNQL
jgi:hypothetical protein